MTILVTGATGKAGRQVVTHLLARGQRVRALTRDPSKADFPPDVEVIKGDLTDPDTLDLTGVTGMHLITIGGDDYATLNTGPQIAERAEQAGVRKVAILWNGAPGPVEEAFTRSSVEWTRIEPVDFMGNALYWAEEIRAHGRVEEPFGDSPNALIDERDVGAVVAAVLTEDGHAGKTYPLTGPQALTPRDKLRIIGEAIGRELEFVELTEQQARDRWRAMGQSDEIIDMLAEWHGNPPSAAYTVADTVERITGRPPRSFQQWVAEHVDAFR